MADFEQGNYFQHTLRLGLKCIRGEGHHESSRGEKKLGNHTNVQGFTWLSLT